MKKISIMIAAIVVSLGLVACSGNTEPVPTVTVTEQAAPQDSFQSSTQKYVEFVNNNGGIYASVLANSDLIDMGNTICTGLGSGLSRDAVIQALAEALLENDLADENGTKFAASLLAGAEVYLCPNNF